MNERCAKRRDELVEAGWLRDLRSRRSERLPEPRPRSVTDPPGRKAAASVLRDQRVATAER